ncbi:MAG: cobalamin-dependent protein, partial [Candidatus Hermodarchaeota archaeon]
MRKAGIVTMIFDRQLNNSLKKLKEVILTYKPDVIGISAMTAQIYDTKLIIKKVREWMPNIIIIVGGVHFTAEPQDGLD